MTDAVAKTPPINRAEVRAQRLAWGVLLTAFAVFCAVCLISGIGIHYFLFKSTVPMHTELTMGRGTAIVTNPDLSPIPVQNRQSLSNRVVVRTDQLGQALLSFYDSNDDAQFLVASVIMSGNTSIDLEELSRPRFEWSTAGYEIHLDKFSGRIEVTITEGIARPIQMVIDSDFGGQIRLTESGKYSINVTDAQMLVETISGSAEFTAGRFNQVVEGGDRVMYDFADNELTPLNPYIRILGTTAFNQTNVFASNSESSASTWTCFNQANPVDNITGSYGLAVEDGRPVLHFSRSGSSQHGESVCNVSQSGGIDVSEYQYLSVEVLFKINSQSLSGCGEEGSECPLMLRLDYLPPGTDEARIWNHGFYLWNSQPNYPSICQTCTQEHEIINPGVWYRYRSDNLFGRLLEDERPERIVALRVYASGHEYDTYVSEVSLFVSE